ncbi:MAG: alpha/beta fold hydrolase [Pseudomonadota bacterium]
MPVTLTHIAHAPPGPERAPPLLIAHGLFGSARNFNSLGRRLAVDRRVVMVDMRNHGDAPWDDRMDYAAMAEDLGDAVRRLCGGRAVVLGHSMGGKATMALALTDPATVEAALIADIAPISYANVHGGYLTAMSQMDIANIARRADADPLLADAVPEAGLRGFLLQNLRIEGGAARWRLNLAALEAAMPALTGWPEDWRTPYDGPTLFLHGTASDYVPPSAHGAIKALFSNAEIQGLDGAGHWLHAEQPEAFHAAVSAWLARL